VLELLGERAVVHDSGFATDTVYPEIHYLPEDMQIDLKRQDIKWTSKGEEQHLKLLPGRIYFHRVATSCVWKSTPRRPVGA